MDLNGEPLAGARLRGLLALPIVEDEKRVSRINMAPVETDAVGRFTILGLVPGSELSVSVSDPRFPYADLRLREDQDRLRIEGVEAYDLGVLIYAPRR